MRILILLLIIADENQILTLSSEKNPRWRRNPKWRRRQYFKKRIAFDFHKFWYRRKMIGGATTQCDVYKYRNWHNVEDFNIVFQYCNIPDLKEQSFPESFFIYVDFCISRRLIEWWHYLTFFLRYQNLKNQKWWTLILKRMSGQSVENWIFKKLFSTNPFFDFGAILDSCDILYFFRLITIRIYFE